MKVKQIDACDVFSHLIAGKEVVCVDFGLCNIIKGGEVINLVEKPLAVVRQYVNKPNNLFFEEDK